jgi:hypothetical protein
MQTIYKFQGRTIRWIFICFLSREMWAHELYVMISRVVNMRQFLRFAGVRSLAEIVIKRDESLDQNNADWEKRSDEAPEELQIPAQADAIEFDPALLAAQADWTGQGNRPCRLNPFLALHWNGDVEQRAYDALWAWPDSWNWKMPPINISPVSGGRATGRFACGSRCTTRRWTCS